jgi:hypothetical protein
MTTDLMNARLQASSPGERVASYSDIRGAHLALSHLIDAGFPVEEVAVQPGDLRVRPETLADGEPPAPSVSIVVAALAGAAVAGLAAGVARTSVAFGLVTALIAIPITVVVAFGGTRVSSHWRTRRARGAAHVVVAGHFDIVCSRRAEEANHLLASWWDPRARPSISPETGSGPRRRQGRRAPAGQGGE